MTTHTNPAAYTPTGVLTTTRVYRTMLTAVVTMTILLTSWTAVQAKAIDDIIDGNGPAHPSIRQLEREGDRNAGQHLSIRQLERAAGADVGDVGPVSIRQAERAAELRRERLAQLDAVETHRFANRAAATSDDAAQREQARPEPVDFAGLTPDDLTRLEYTELRRFRNRAPVNALAAIDEQIRQLRASIT